MATKVPPNLVSGIFSEHTPDSFNDRAMELFLFQFQNNEVYNRFCRGVGASPATVKEITNIPFLPVEIFKTHRVASLDSGERLIFRSSGTNDQGFSCHPVFMPELYERSILEGFQCFFGNPAQYIFAFLTPSPEEKPDSSLAHMGQVLVRAGGQGSGFFMGKEDLLKVLLRQKSEQPLFIVGLSFALADLAEKGCEMPPDSIVLETGGMKGKRRELHREEMHELLKRGLKVKKIGSEYSMCELFSQAYALDGIRFSTPPWMRVMIRNLEDPLEILSVGKTGGINIVDLANVASCSFIATGDLGILQSEAYFEVLGRIRPQDLKGCAIFAEE